MAAAKKTAAKTAAKKTTTRKKPAGRSQGGLTAQIAAEENDRHAEERSARAAELSMVIETNKGENQPPLNYTDEDFTDDELDEGEVPADPEAEVLSDDVVDTTAAPAPAPVVVDKTPANETVRLGEDVPYMRIGPKVYEFVSGRKYKVPHEVANHLREGGYIY